jgi:hypothetical protein
VPGLSECPTACDDDCELGAGRCHERHSAYWRRGHSPDECESVRGIGRPGDVAEVILARVRLAQMRSEVGHRAGASPPARPG